jgi:hypothetical protein
MELQMASPYPEYPPDFEVWNHLESGLQSAFDELNVLDVESRDITMHIARQLVENSGVILLETGMAGWAERGPQILEHHDWIRHAADCVVAQEGIGRSTKALERYRRLQPVVHESELPRHIIDYIKEASHSYLFGFDVACIALCRATLEQVLREVLVRRGVYTEPRLKRERPTGGALLENAKREGLLPHTYDAAKRVVERGDVVLHRGLYETSTLPVLAADSINDLVKAAVELLR